MKRRFMDLVLAGEASAAEIEDYIARWKRNPDSTETVHEYLGMSQREYNRWLKNPLDIHRIVDDRLH